MEIHIPYVVNKINVWMYRMVIGETTKIGPTSA